MRSSQAESVKTVLPTLPRANTRSNRMGGVTWASQTTQKDVHIRLQQNVVPFLYRQSMCACVNIRICTCGRTTRCQMSVEDEDEANGRNRRLPPGSGDKQQASRVGSVGRSVDFCSTDEGDYMTGRLRQQSEEMKEKPA